MIGIIAAMSKEIAGLLEVLESQSTISIADKVFYVGTIAKKPCVIAQSGIGKINAAMTAALLFSQFEIESVISTGIAGGLKPASIGDLVLASGVASFDIDLRAIDKEAAFGQILPDPLVYLSDERLLSLAKYIAMKQRLPHLVGVLVSGDTFVTNSNTLASIRAEVAEVVGCEMESHAVGQVAAKFAKPCLTIRGISDVIDAPDQAKTYETVSTEIARKTVKFVIELIKKH